MKPFHAWVEDMANSIEDASTIVKDENEEIVELPQPDTLTDKPYCPLTHEELAEYWDKSYGDDYDDSYFD